MTRLWWLPASALLLVPAVLEHASALAQPALAPAAVVLHVDHRHPGADDRNGGTAGAPLKSIGEAARRAIDDRRAGTTTRVLVHPGVYRESIVLAADTPADAPIVLEGVGEGEAIVSGSDVWRQWQREGRSRVFRHAWPFGWRPAEIPPCRDTC